MEGARADVLIETVRADASGAVPDWHWHAERLIHSAAALGFPPVPPELPARVRDAALPGQNSRLRVLFDRAGKITVEAAPLSGLALPAQVQWAPDVLGAHAVLDSAQPLLRHKTTYRPWYDAATAWLAQHPACFDLLFINERDELCEGSRTNVYLLKNGEWLTPPLSSGCLPGTQRAALLAAGQVRVARLTRSDLDHCEGVRLSNGLRGWFDAVAAAH